MSMVQANAFGVQAVASVQCLGGERDMKIYLLMLLIGTLLTLIRFTATPERKSEPAQQ